MSLESRQEVLRRIGSALTDEELQSPAETAMEWEGLSRAYDREPQLSVKGKLDLLEDRLRDYDAEVTRVDDCEIADTIAAVLAERGSRPTLVPQGFPSAWIHIRFCD